MIYRWTTFRVWIYWTNAATTCHQSFIAPVGLAFYLFYALKKSGAITTNDWSIGQVVAVFTLVPVPVKAVYRIHRELHHSIFPD